MKISPFAPPHSDIYWFRKPLLKWGSWIVFVTSIIEVFISYATSDSFTEISIILAIYSIFPLILVYKDKIIAAGYVVLAGFTVIIMVRSVMVYSAMLAEYLALILIVSGFLISFRGSTILFLIDMVYVLICSFLGIFTWSQPIDPETGLFYGNTNTVLFPSMFIFYLVTAMISKILMAGMKTQNEHMKLLEETGDRLIIEEKMNAIRLLAGGIAHDFNNVLTAIIGNLQLIDLKNNDEAENQSYIQDIQSAADQAKNIANQLLQFSRPSKPNKIVQNPADVIHEIAQFSLRGRKSKAIINICPGVWNVSIDKSQIGQVLQNLIINADQAMPDGGMIIINADNIKFETDYLKQIPAGNYVCISVIDKGIGISKENISNLFTPFFTTKKDGTGLGLAMSLSIIMNHNGYILVTSDTKKGTKFDIYLPASFESIQKEGISDINNNHFSGKVLLLDDNPAILQTAQSMFSKLGFQVGIFSTPKDIIEAFKEAKSREEKIEFVVLDLTIPGEMSGQEVLPILREIDPNIKAMVSSGYSEDKVLEQYKTFGFNAALKKPYNLIELTAAVNKMVSSK